MHKPNQAEVKSIKYRLSMIHFFDFLGEQSTTGNDRNKPKKKGGILKQRPDIDANGDDTSAPSNPMDESEKLERLHELENKFIGGEEADNDTRKRKREEKLKKMKEKREQRKKFGNAMNGDDDDTMMKVFDNAQEEVSYS